jgi:hypothetical protein
LLLFLVYTDDLDVIFRTTVDLKEAFLSLVQVADNMGLKRSDETKRMVMGKSTI